jgi:spermidine synthase
VACYGKKGQALEFYEIDALVDRIAHDTRFFTYLRDCPPEIHITLGDGRVGISREDKQRFGLIVGDAFSSDAIPMHLMTLEAVRMYFEKLKPGGMLAFNISNRTINLLPVLSAIAKELKVHAAWQRSHAREDPLAFDAEWVVLAQDAQTLKRLQGEWRKLPEPRPRHLWRDDYSNLLGSLK